MKILIIGFGSLGKKIANKLKKRKDVNEIYFITKSKKRVEKGFVQIGIKDVDRSFDYIILTFSGISDENRKRSFRLCKNTFDVRKVELKYNLKILKKYIPLLKKLSNKTKIIVLTNPVDEIVNYLYLNLPRKQIFGFGATLDKKRYSRILKKEVDCVGLHGNMIPLIKSEPEVYEKLYKKIDQKLLKYFQKKGLPNKFVAEEFGDYFKILNGKRKRILNTSYYLNKPFYGISKIALSLPFIIENGRIIGIKKIKLNDYEEKRFLADVERLKKN
jgi:malate/lactate dehydrogenase